MASRPLETVDPELRDRMRWLIGLRWIAAFGLAVAAAVSSAWPALGITSHPVLGLALALAVANALVLVAAARFPPVGERRLRLFNKAQIGIDLASLAGLCLLSGGIRSPFLAFFVFHMILTSILLSPRDSYEGATVAVGFIAAIYLLSDREARQAPGAVLVVVVMVTTVYTCVYLTTSITTALRARERERARLMEELAARAEALRRAYDEIEETRKLELRYMRKVAHELRSPLTAAISSLQVVGLGMAGELSERQTQLVSRVETRMRQLLKTVDDLLLLARERARANAVAGPGDLVSLDTVISAVVELQEARAQAKGVKLVTDLPPDLPANRADREALTQVFTNLVGNGVKYTPEGGMVRVSALAEEDTVVVRVADTGIGIPPEDLPRVFEEFFRASNARSHAAVGTGLGLAIAKSAVEALGGSVEVSSRQGVGTEFALRLPIGPRQRPAALT